MSTGIEEITVFLYDFLFKNENFTTSLLLLNLSKTSKDFLQVIAAFIKIL